MGYETVAAEDTEDVRISFDEIGRKLLTLLFPAKDASKDNLRELCG